jgi:hypothetical protein
MPIANRVKRSFAAARVRGPAKPWPAQLSGFFIAPLMLLALGAAALFAGWQARDDEGSKI